MFHLSYTKLTCEQVMALLPQITKEAGKEQGVLSIPSELLGEFAPPLDIYSDGWPIEFRRSI